MNAEIPVPFVSHVRPGSEMIFGPQGPIGYRQPEHTPTTSEQVLGYRDIACIIGLPTDTEPKTVKRAVLDWMGLPRPREKVFDAADIDSIMLFAQDMQGLGREVLWIPIDNQAGQHRPKNYQEGDLPSTGKISIMEKVVSENCRPFRFAFASAADGTSHFDIEYGAVGGETGRTFEPYKFELHEINPQKDVIVWSTRLGIHSSRAIPNEVHLTLPLSDFSVGNAQQFEGWASRAYHGMQEFTDMLCRSLHRFDQTHLMIGVEGYINLEGRCVFVDTDFPSADAPRWMRGER